MDMGLDGDTGEPILRFKVRCSSCGEKMHAVTNNFTYLTAKNGDQVDAKCPICGAINEEK